MALLAFLRRRPWLVGTFLTLVSGVSVLARGHYGSLTFWAGVAAVAAGLLIALAGELEYRRQRGNQREGPGADSAGPGRAR